MKEVLVSQDNLSTLAELPPAIILGANWMPAVSDTGHHQQAYSAAAEHRLTVQRLHSQGVRRPPQWKRLGERRVRATEEDVVGQGLVQEWGPRGEEVLPLAAVDALIRQRPVQGPPWGGGVGERRLRRGERMELKNRAKTTGGQFSGSHTQGPEVGGNERVNKITARRHTPSNPRAQPGSLKVYHLCLHP